MDDQVDLTRSSLSQSPPLLGAIERGAVGMPVSESREVSPKTVVPNDDQKDSVGTDLVLQDSTGTTTIDPLLGTSSSDHFKQASHSSPVFPMTEPEEPEERQVSINTSVMNHSQDNTPHSSELIVLSDDDEEEDNDLGPHTHPKHDFSSIRDPMVKQEPVGDLDMSLIDDDPLLGLDALPRLELPPEQVEQSIEQDVAPVANASDYAEEDMAVMLAEFNKNNSRPVEADVDVNDDADVEVESDEEDARRRKEFAKVRKAYMRKEKAGQADMKDTIEYKMAEKDELTRRAQRKGKRAYIDEEASMFFPERQPSSSPDDDVSDFSDDEVEIRGNTPATQTNAKKRGYAEVSADNGSDDEMPSDADTSRNKPIKRGRGGRAAARARGKSSGGKPAAASSTEDRSRAIRGRGRGPGRGRGGGRGKRKQNESTVFESLLQYDIFDQANKNREAEPQPTFTTRNKTHALAELIASIPGEQRDLHIGDKKTLDNCVKMFNGRGAMRADGAGKWKLRGMITSLHHYQTIGAGRMRQRENEGKPSGGLLSDEMGLGKTLMAIANIVDGRAAPEDRHRATLVITPAALQQQWYNEIVKHVDQTAFIKNVLIYKSSAFAGGQDHTQVLGQFDVVITSYHEIIRSYPKKVFPADLITARAKEEYWQRYFEEHKGPLHRVKWHRIVLDEAQAIKNHNSRTSEGVWKLRGKYRWTLSGTPVVNSLEEFFAYFRFLKVFATGDFELWKKNFCKKGSEDALKRLKAMLEKMMIRRTHKDQLFGRPIIQLPPVKPVKTVELEFSAFERALYKIVRDRFVTRIKSWKSDSSTTNNYANIFILLLRLRQLTAHMLLIQKTLKDLLQIEDLEKLWSLTSSPEYQGDELSRKQAAAVQECLGNVSDADASACTSNEGQHGDSSVGQPSSASVIPDPTLGDQESSGPSSSTDLVITSAASGNAVEVSPRFSGDISAQFRKCLKAMRDDGQWEKANLRSLCPLCNNPPDKPHVTSCLHIYCFTCLNDLAYAGLMNGEDVATCIECSCKFKKAEAYAAQAFDDAGKGTPVGTASRQNSTARGRQRSRDKHEDDVDWYKLAGPIIQSTKTIAALKQMEEWWAEDKANGVEPCKILLFSQFRGVLRVFEKICDEKLAEEKARKHRERREQGLPEVDDKHLDLSWGHAQFHGEMSFEARNKAIDKFSNDPNCKVLLAAMKAGGVGLNLTAANRVILIDLWWNVAMETQAYCRVFRIGQTRDVEVVRFAVKNTVDMDILKMQERKTREIDAAMEKKNRLGGLTTDELLRLFGPLEDQMDDENGENGGRANGGGAGSRRRRVATPQNLPFIMPNDPYLPPDSDVEDEAEGAAVVVED